MILILRHRRFQLAFARHFHFRPPRFQLSPYFSFRRCCAAFDARISMPSLPPTPLHARRHAIFSPILRHFIHTLLLIFVCCCQLRDLMPERQRHAIADFSPVQFSL